MSMLGITPLTKKPLEIQAAEALRDAIVEGRIPAGSRITETQLAQELELSRGSIRSALQQLMKEGLTTLIPYTGWMVVRLTSEDVWELYTLRSGMERLAAKLLAQSSEKPRLHAFKAAYEALKTACNAGDHSLIAEADFGLHKALIEQCGHRRLSAQYETIERQIRVCIRSSDSLVESPAAILKQHSPMASAILRHKPEEAAALAEEHNLIEGMKLREHLRNHPDPSEYVLRPSRGSTRLQNRKSRAISA